MVGERKTSDYEGDLAHVGDSFSFSTETKKYISQLSAEPGKRQELGGAKRFAEMQKFRPTFDYLHQLARKAKTKGRIKRLRHEKGSADSEELFTFLDSHGSRVLYNFDFIEDEIVCFPERNPTLEKICELENPKRFLEYYAVLTGDSQHYWSIVFDKMSTTDVEMINELCDLQPVEIERFIGEISNFPWVSTELFNGSGFLILEQIGSIIQLAKQDGLSDGQRESFICANALGLMKQRTIYASEVLDVEKTTNQIRLINILISDFKPHQKHNIDVNELLEVVIKNGLLYKLVFLAELGIEISSLVKRLSKDRKLISYVEAVVSEVDSLIDSVRSVGETEFKSILQSIELRPKLSESSGIVRFIELEGVTKEYFEKLGKVEKKELIMSFAKKSSLVSRAEFEDFDPESATVFFEMRKLAGVFPKLKERIFSTFIASMEEKERERLAFLIISDIDALDDMKGLIESMPKGIAGLLAEFKKNKNFKIQRYFEYFYELSAREELGEFDREKYDSLWDFLNKYSKWFEYSDEHEKKALDIFVRNNGKADCLELVLFWVETNNYMALIQTFSKESFTEIVGDEKAERFFRSLPTSSDERRNAFLHNDYDRTSGWLALQAAASGKNYQMINVDRPEGDREVLLRHEFNIIEETDLVSDFISSFGFSDQTKLFAIYRSLWLHEHNGNEIPDFVVLFGVSSTSELVQHYNALRTILSSREPIRELPSFSELEKLLFASITKHDTHTFSGRLSLGEILRDFELNPRNDRDRYSDFEPFEINVGTENVSFEPTADDRKKFDNLSGEFIEATKEIANGEYWSLLRNELREMIEEKLGKLMGLKPNQHIDKQIEKLQSTLENVISIDSTLMFIEILTAEFYHQDKKTQAFISSMIRRLIFQQVISHHPNQGRNSVIQSFASSDISPKAVRSLSNFLREDISHHALDFSKEEIWDKEVLEFANKFWSKKNIDVLRTIINDEIAFCEDMKKRFSVDKSDGSFSLELIPDRGLVGEFAGYIANACYTAEHPLLNWDVVPHKIVDVSSDFRDLIGSVLIFPNLATVEGNPALLVRAINIPIEQNIDISAFIETLLDKMLIAAKKMGAELVLLPGIKGAISNYDTAINHVSDTYVSPEKRVSLSETFAFNGRGHDLTNDCYIARSV